MATCIELLQLIFPDVNISETVNKCNFKSKDMGICFMLVNSQVASLNFYFRHLTMAINSSHTNRHEASEEYIGWF